VLRAVDGNNMTTQRAQIFDLLRMLSSEEEQIEYERNVPHVDVTAELLCMWFDDFYHPNHKSFANHFNDREIEILDDFNRYYDERTEKLPESQGTVRTWHSSPVWREIMEKAKDTLERLSC